MASDSANLPVDGSLATPPDQLIVNLQVVSPSVGVNRPLLFPDLVATTTIKQLKERIRQTLPLRPSDENQRLIHRGRALLRESDSLLDIFGADTLKTPDRHTIHLVIRDVSDGQSATPPVASRGRSPAAPAGQQHAQRPQDTYAQFPPQGLPQFARRTQVHTSPNPGQQPRMPSPSPHHTPEQAAAFQQQHQNMTHWLSHLGREAMTRALVNQNQRGRAQMGLRGIGDNAATGPGGNREARSASPAPAPSHTIYRETIGPNGHTYQVETVIRTSGPTPQGGLSQADVQNILRGADSAQATSNMTSAMQRSASGASLHNRPFTQPGVTTPVHPSTNSQAGSGRATPDPTSRSSSGGNHFTIPSSSGISQPRQGMEVYILSSPDGPRGLLVNNATSETFYTPRMTGQTSLPLLGHMSSFPSFANVAQSATSGHTQQQQQQQHHQQHFQQANMPQAPDQEPAQAQPEIGNHPIHANNNPAVGLPFLVAQIWAHAWLVLRLGLFVWFFTSPNTSWSRWLTVVGLALLMFVIATGVLNGVAENVWRPLGRHIENLLPTIDRPQRQGHAEGADGRTGNATQNGEPEPTQMAARLVAERRAQRSWLSNQFRRVERAGLLFLASIAPGVAERHIANIEAEIREEERRQREAEAAAAAAAEAANNANAAEAPDGADGADGAAGNPAGVPEEPAGPSDGQQRVEANGQQDIGSSTGFERGEGAREGLVAL